MPTAITDLEGLDWVFQSKRKPFLDCRTYNFRAFSPGGSLAASTPATITFSASKPVPLGVNGSNTKHYLYISGGTGTSEAVLITGGTAVSGGNSGTITFTPANNHTGAWTISSATAGITEAEYCLPSGSTSPPSALGTVVIPAGSYTIYGAIPILKGVTFQGFGPLATVLQPATASTVMFDANLPVHPAGPQLARDEIRFRHLQFDGHQFAGNTVIGIRELQADSTTQEYGLAGMLVDQVAYNNIGTAELIHRGSNITHNNVEAYCNTTFQFTTGNPATDTTFINSFAIFFQGFRYYQFSLDGSLASTLGTHVAIIQGVHVETFQLTDSNFEGPGGVSGPDAVAFSGACENLTFATTTFVTWNNCIGLFQLTNNAQTYYPSYIGLMGVTCSNMYGYGLLTPTGTSLAANSSSRNITITNCEFSNPNIAQSSCGGINFQPYTHACVVTACKFPNANPTPAQNHVTVGANCDSITLSFNKFESDSSAYTGGSSTGIFVNSLATNIDYRYGNTFKFYDVTVNDAAATVASAATLVIPLLRASITVTGTTTITSISGAPPVGGSFTLLFGAGISVTKGSDLHLASNFGPTTTDGTLTLLFDGTNFREIGRSVN